MLTFSSSSPYLRVFFLDIWVVVCPIRVCAALQRRTEAGRSRASCAANTAHAWMATGGTEWVREGERERRKEGGYNSRRTGANQQLLQRLVVLATDRHCLPLPLTGSSPAKWMMSVAEACVPAFCTECSLKKITPIFSDSASAFPSAVHFSHVPSCFPL